MRKTVPLLGILLGLLLPVAPGSSVGVTVHVTDNAFNPSPVTVALGSTVTWSFEGVHEHTTTSAQGFWDSPRLISGPFARKFTSSGGFGYFCRVHDGMRGKVVVPLQASGGPAVGWTLRWSTTTAPAGRAFDVQYRREGTTTWRNFRVDTKAAKGLFNPARAARYFLRARTTNTTTGQESGWSPQLSKRIT